MATGSARDTWTHGTGWAMVLAGADGSLRRRRSSEVRDVNLRGWLLLLALSSTAAAGELRVRVEDSSCTSAERLTWVFEPAAEGWRAQAVEREVIRGHDPGVTIGPASLRISFEEVDDLRRRLSEAADCSDLASPSSLPSGFGREEAAARKERVDRARPLLASLGLTPRSVAAARERILASAARGEPVPETNEAIERALEFESVAVVALDRLTPSSGAAAFGSRSVEVRLPGTPTVVAFIDLRHPLSVTVDGRSKSVCDPALSLRLRRLVRPELEEAAWPAAFFDSPRAGWFAIRRELDLLAGRRAWRALDGWAVLDERFSLGWAQSREADGQPIVLVGHFAPRAPSPITEWRIEAVADGERLRVNVDALLERWRAVRDALGERRDLAAWRSRWPDSQLVLDDLSVAQPWSRRQREGAWAAAGLPGSELGLLHFVREPGHSPSALALFGRADEPLLLLRSLGLHGGEWIDGHSTSNGIRSSHVLLAPDGTATRLDPR